MALRIVCSLNAARLASELEYPCPRVWRKGGEAHSPSCMKSSVKFPQSVMIWGAMSSAGVGPLCFLKTNVTAPVYQEILEHTCFLLLTSFLKMLISFSSRIWHLPTLPKVGVLDWPANSPDLNTRPNNADDLKATVKETWASIPPQQCHKLITSMPRRIEAVIKAKGAPTKY